MVPMRMKLGINPQKGVYSMPNSKRLPDVLTESEQESLLSQPNSRYPTGQRNYTLLRTMLDTALRSFEAVSLKWEHVDLMSGKLMVKEEKGAKDRNLWLDADNIDLFCYESLQEDK